LGNRIWANFCWNLWSDDESVDVVAQLGVEVEGTDELDLGPVGTEAEDERQ
jgi:hypothetical protein